MKNLKKMIAAVAAGVVGTSAFAAGTGPDFTALTSAVSVDTVISAIMAIAVIVIGVVLAVAGAKRVIAMVRGV
jgi:hypothetical protein